MVNTPVTQPQPIGLMCRSSCIRGPATEMQTRSRYVMPNSRTRRATTRCQSFEGRSMPHSAQDASQVTVLVSAERISLVFAIPSGSILMLFLAAIVRLTVPREAESNDLLVQSRLGNVGLTVITLVYVLIVLWRQ